jgi:hypothetical protein
MTLNSKRGAYFVPDKWKKWWKSLTNWQFHRFLGIASGHTHDEIHSQPPHDFGSCRTCDMDLKENKGTLTCSNCRTFLP